MEVVVAIKVVLMVGVGVEVVLMEMGCWWW